MMVVGKDEMHPYLPGVRDCDDLVGYTLFLANDVVYCWVKGKKGLAAMGDASLNAFFIC